MAGKAAFCGSCGTPLSAKAQFCPGCGSSVAAPAAPPPPPQAPYGTPYPPTAPPRTGGVDPRVWIGIAVVVSIAAGLFLVLRGGDPDPGTLTADGIGPIRIGMSAEEAEATGWIDHEEDEIFGPVCSFGTFTRQAGEDGGFDEDTLSVIFLDDELSIIYAHEFENGPAPPAGSGIAIGDEDDDVRDAFGDDVEEYDDEYGTHHLDVFDDGADRGLSFLTDESGEIVSIEAGNEAGLGLIEGCA